MKGRILTLAGEGFEPKRFVAIVVMSLREHCTFEVDDAPVGLEAARGYLASILASGPDKERVRCYAAELAAALTGKPVHLHRVRHSNAVETCLQLP